VPLHRPSAATSILLAAAGILLPHASPLPAQDGISTIVPGRYIVIYRNGAIPGDAETRVSAAGVRMLHRNERFGIATVQTAEFKRVGFPVARARAIAATQASDDASVMRRLAAQPNVEYVLHDRIVSAHRLQVQPVALEASFSVVVNNVAHQPIRLRPPSGSTGPTLQRDPSMAPVVLPSGPPTPPTPYDTYYNSPQGWAVRQVGGYGLNVAGGPVTGPWNQTTGKGVRIAILDSGVDETHPDIAPNLALNLSEVNQSDLPSACDDGSPQDQEGHGTWTASLAAAAIGPGTGQVIGVAPSATLLNIKVLERMPASGSALGAQCEAGQASGLLSWVIQGIEDAIANHADVISMSLGAIVDLSTGEGSGLKAAFDRVTYAATQAGAVLVAAAGNDGYNLSNARYIEIPAQSRGVLAVIASTNPECAENTLAGATCGAGPPVVAYYSNYGAPLNAVAAPGGSYPSGDDMAVSGWVRGACSSGLPNTVDGLPSDAQHSLGCFNLGHVAYVQAIGTSASAPLVAGVAALLRAEHPSWDAGTIVGKLRTAADSFATLPVPQVDAESALRSE